MRKITYLAVAASLAAGTAVASAPLADASPDRYAINFTAAQVAQMHDNIEHARGLCDGLGAIKGIGGDVSKLACGMSANAQERDIADAYKAHKGMNCTYVEEDIEDLSYYECSVA